jgi:hypothetical protein
MARTCGAKSAVDSIARTHWAQSMDDVMKESMEEPLTGLHALVIAAFLASQMIVPRTVHQMCRTVSATLATTAMDPPAHRVGHVMYLPQGPAHAMARTCRDQSAVDARQAPTGAAHPRLHALVIAAFLASRITVPRAVHQLQLFVRATLATTEIELLAHRVRHVMHTPRRTALAMARTCQVFANKPHYDLKVV